MTHGIGSDKTTDSLVATWRPKELLRNFGGHKHFSWKLMHLERMNLKVQPPFRSALILSLCSLVGNLFFPSRKKSWMVLDVTSRLSNGKYPRNDLTKMRSTFKDLLCVFWF